MHFPHAFRTQGWPEATRGPLVLWELGLSAAVSTMWPGVGGGCSICSSRQPLPAKMPSPGDPVLWWLGMALGTSGPPSVRAWVLARQDPGACSCHHVHSKARPPLPPGGR